MEQTSTQLKLNLAHSRVFLFPAYVTGREKGLSWTADWWKRRSVIASLHCVLSCCPLALSIETHKILRRGLLRGRDFLNSWCARAWTTAFWRESLVAVFIFLWVSGKCRSGGSNLSTARSIIILRLVENWTFFTKNIRGNFFGENVWWNFPGCICFGNTDKKL